MAQSTSSGFHRHSSWGRTRRPKNVNGNTSTAAIVLESTDGTAPSAVTDGYQTENQRFLHLAIKDTSAGDEDTNITVWVWHHAFQQWSILMVPTDLDGSATAAYVQAKFLAERDQYQTVILDIAGADRVAFVADGSDTVSVYAACSTF